MALGKNLKKQQLIPTNGKAEGKKKSQGKKAESQSSTTAEAKKKAVKKPTSSKQQATKSSAKKATPKKSTPKKSSTESTRTAKSRAKRDTSSRQAKELIERKKRLTEKFKAEFQKISEKKLHLIVFRLGSQFYAIEIGQTKEVVVTPEISEVPHMPFYVRGLVNIRGAVIVALDLEKKYGLLKDEDELNRKYIIVINSNEFNVGILSKDVPTTLIIEGKNLSSPAGYMFSASIDISYIKGIVKEENRLIYLIDIEELIAGDQVGEISGLENSL